MSVSAADFEKEVMKQYSEASLTKISMWALREGCRNGSAYPVFAFMVQTVGFAYLLLQGNGKWAEFIVCVLGYLGSLLLVFVSWADVLESAFPDHYRDHKEAINLRSTNRIYLRFLEFKSRFAAEPTPAVLEKVSKLIKAEREYLEVDWGLADAVRKAVFNLALYALFAWPFLLVVDDDFRAKNNKVLARLIDLIPEQATFLIVAISLLVLPIVLNAFGPVSEKKRSKELQMFLVWWRERS